MPRSPTKPTSRMEKVNNPDSPIPSCYENAGGSKEEIAKSMMASSSTKGTSPEGKKLKPMMKSSSSPEGSPKKKVRFQIAPDEVLLEPQISHRSPIETNPDLPVLPDHFKKPFPPSPSRLKKFDKIKDRDTTLEEKFVPLPPLEGIALQLQDNCQRESCFSIQQQREIPKVKQPICLSEAEEPDDDSQREITMVKQAVCLSKAEKTEDSHFDAVEEIRRESRNEEPNRDSQQVIHGYREKYPTSHDALMDHTYFVGDTDSTGKIIKGLQKSTLDDLPITQIRKFIPIDSDSMVLTNEILENVSFSEQPPPSSDHIVEGRINLVPVLEDIQGVIKLIDLKRLNFQVETEQIPGQSFCPTPTEMDPQIEKHIKEANTYAQELRHHTERLIKWINNKDSSFQDLEECCKGIKDVNVAISKYQIVSYRLTKQHKTSENIDELEEASYLLEIENRIKKIVYNLLTEIRFIYDKYRDDLGRKQSEEGKS